MLMRTDPFRELDRLTTAMLGGQGRPMTMPAAMPMTAYRDGESFVIHLDLPGVSPDTIDLTVEQNVLTVRAERKAPEGDGVEPVIDERTYGMFSRQVFLGETLDTDNLRADYDAGVLTITIPVAERAKPRKVEIAVGGSSKQIAG